MSDLTSCPVQARTRVKICGLTRRDDVQAAVKAGADALGFVFYPPSPRSVTPEQAADLLAEVPPFVVSVGLFVNPDPVQLQHLLKQLPLDLLQFHGDESEEFCVQFQRPYIKALRMKPELDPVKEAAKWPSAKGFLLDAYQAGVPGGTGERFDWQRFPSSDERPWILAGGLTPDNLVEALQITQPYAVDVSGGVEASRGIKCPMKIKEFLARLAEA
ncbi:phosphoribosylanthranilate isomerase [Marinospirillum celere]|uniref:N-(5'-phosphoribosyl)anthranilate isomerase n=1 Tax=Marinospirillum celere TaxID=1122252 RepID=A0A1I1JFW8_9GAMM|nr:phosphoribosylanthranilate isomerase [Marinospirillum celere]SFC44853.1 phosphoribosylanthranilate isomerase [Marinospirillum celere]